MAAMHQYQMCEESIWDLFIGNVGGCIGETSALLLLIGFAYLLYKKVIKITIPAAYIGTVAYAPYTENLYHVDYATSAYDNQGNPVELGSERNEDGSIQYCYYRMDRDMTGVQFRFAVSRIDRSKNPDTDVLIQDTWDLTLFARDAQSLEYILVRCNYQ